MYTKCMILQVTEGQSSGQKKQFIIQMNVVTHKLPGLLLLQFTNDKKIFLPDKI